MKTVSSLSAQRDQNTKLIGELIERLHNLHQENLQLESQISSLLEGEEEAASTSSIELGDRAVVLSPNISRRGNTGHVISLTKGKFSATFRTDSEEVYDVRVTNLFKLKKKDKK